MISCASAPTAGFDPFCNRAIIKKKNISNYNDHDHTDNYNNAYNVRQLSMSVTIDGYKTLILGSTSFEWGGNTKIRVLDFTMSLIGLHRQ
jgi:hypothetical protein